MKPAHPDEFKDAEPIVDFRYYLPRNHPLHVRLAKKIINETFLTRPFLAACLAVAGISAADVVWGSHDFTKIVKCDVSYIDTTKNELIKKTYNTSRKTMITAFDGCAQALNSIDGEDRVFAGYTSSSGVVIPGLNIIDGSPESVGLNGAPLTETDPQKRLEEAKAVNAQERRWLVEEYMRIAGKTYAGENAQFMNAQAGYAISDKVEDTVNNIGHWFDDQKTQAGQAISNWWHGRQSPIMAPDQSLN